MLLELQAKLGVLQLMFLVSKLQPMLIGVASRGGGVGGASGDGGVVGVGSVGGASSMRRGRSKSLSSRRRSQHGRSKSPSSRRRKNQSLRPRFWCFQRRCYQRSFHLYNSN